MSATPTETRTPGDTDPAAVRRAISSTTRPPRAGALSSAITFGWRGMLKVKHVPEQLLDVTITPVMFVLMFTYLFGGAIAGSTADYLDYILPGILVMSVLFTTVYAGIALNTDLTKGVVDRFRSLPIWRAAPLLGSLLGDAVRYVISCWVSCWATARRRASSARSVRWPSSSCSPSGCRGCSWCSGCCCARPTRS